MRFSINRLGLVAMVVATMAASVSCSDGAPPEPSPTASSTSEPFPTTSSTSEPLPTASSTSTNFTLEPAPGALEFVESPTGEVPEGPGVHFLNVDTGTVEGWRERDFDSYDTWEPEFDWHRLAISDDNRLVALPGSDGGGVLVDRDTAIIYRWEGDAEFVTSDDGRLAAGGGRVLIQFPNAQDEHRFAVVDLDPEPTVVVTFGGTGPAYHGLVSADGNRVLVAGDAVQIFDVEAGEAQLIAHDPSVWRPSTRNTLDGTAFLLLGLGHAEAREAGWAHYTWDGDLIAAGAGELIGPPWEFHPSPNGDLLAWATADSPTGPTAVNVVDTKTGAPVFQVPQANTCHGSTAGNRWLADGSGIVVRTPSGYAIAMRDGGRRALPIGDNVPIGDSGELIPSPSATNVFATQWLSVVDAEGTVLSAVERPEWVKPWFPSWGDAGSELRFVTLMVGRGPACQGL